LHLKKTKEVEWPGPTNHNLEQQWTIRAGAQAPVMRSHVPEAPANDTEGTFADEMLSS